MKRLALITFIVASTSYAQAPVGEFQQWNAVMSTVHVGKDNPALAFWLDVQTRRTPDGVAQIVRPGVGYQATSWLSFWAGYAWIPTFTDGVADPIDEHRVWQQVFIQYETAFRLNLQARTRVEQRFHERGGEVGVRGRQFFRLSWRPSADVPVGGLISDELFIGFNATSWGQPAGIDQNRFFIGPFFQLTPWARIEAGYLMVYMDRTTDRLLHTFLAAAVITPRF